jgi:hypothetical protein
MYGSSCLLQGAERRCEEEGRDEVLQVLGRAKAGHGCAKCFLTYEHLVNHIDGFDGLTQRYLCSEFLFTLHLVARLWLNPSRTMSKRTMLTIMSKRYSESGN